MSVAALVVAILALVISGLSVAYTRRATHAQEAADRRARSPRLVVSPLPADEGATSVIYALRNDGPQDLDAIVIYRPRPNDDITYPIARTGHDWVADEVDLGPLAMTQEARFTLGVGVAASLPTFQVRIECRAGRDTWDLPETLEPPRRGLGMY